MTQTHSSNLIWPTLGIVTALPKEYAAMKALLDNPESYTVHEKEYTLGDVASVRGGVHQVVLVLAAEGESRAAVRGILLVSAFPSIRDILMVGIAGGVPYPSKPDRHVRLGDVVVSGEGGVVQYDYVTDTGKFIIPRHPPRPPSARLLEAVRLLEADEYNGARPWLTYIDQSLMRIGSKRPANTTDKLMDSSDLTLLVPHPRDSGRSPGKPRIFRGTIASANRLLKNAKLRDKIRADFDVKAVEMEASGIADAAWETASGYLVIRGICDYCDSSKSDAWQQYAAAAAAGYTRALISSMPVFADPRLLTREDQDVASKIVAQTGANQALGEQKTPLLLLRDFSYYSSDPYHSPEEGPYYPIELVAGPSVAASFTIASASRNPFRLQNVYVNVLQVEPLKRSTFPVYERGNGAEPILSWVELNDVVGPSRIMAERRSKVGSHLDPSDFHVRVFSRSGGRYHVRLEVDWINMEQQDHTGRFIFEDVFLLDVPNLVTWESLTKGAKQVRALFDSSAPFLADALSAIQPKPEFSILAYSTSEEQRKWIRHGSHSYVLHPGEEKDLTVLTGVHELPYEQGPLQFLIIDDRILLLQEDKRVDEANVIQERERVKSVIETFDRIVQRVKTS